SDPHPADTSYIRHTATISSRQPLRQDDFKVSNNRETLRDGRQTGDNPHHTVQAVDTMNNLATTG
ncbi:hypothetical protein ACIP6Y_39495, partial [Streptomyces sp. NPDC088748]